MFAIVSHFHPSLIFAGKAGTYQTLALALTRVVETNTGKQFSLLWYKRIIGTKCFVVQAPGVWTIKPIMAVILTAL